MVHEITNATDRIFCHSGPFLPLYPPMDLENQNFGKVNNTPEDIIILQMCTINDNHMIVRISCHLDHFLPFYPPLTKSKF